MVNFKTLKTHHLQEYVARCQNLQLFGNLYDAALAELEQRREGV